MKKALVARVILGFVYATILSTRIISKQEFTERRGTEQDWEQMVRTPAVSGYEQQLADQIREKLKGSSPHTNNFNHSARNAPKMAHPDDLYVDVGATSVDEVRNAGVDVLDPVTLTHNDYQLGSFEYTAPGIGDHFGCVALMNLLTVLLIGER